jgi:hypothetical protein
MYHGTWWDRNEQYSLDKLTAGRFTTLLPELEPAEFDPADLRLLADERTSRQERKPASGTGPNPEEDRAITAAYTYLGQFVDHDLTFDPTSRLREFLDRDQIGKLVDFRTPRFDLDNLYGRGPDDQPYMYDPDGIRMLLGEPLSGNPHDPHAAQVPRGPSGRALIGDPRNDENRIVSQLHAIFLRFHNQVADHFGGEASFQMVRDQVVALPVDAVRCGTTTASGETFNHVFGDPHSPVPGLRSSGPASGSARGFSTPLTASGTRCPPGYRLTTAVERPIFARRLAAQLIWGFRPIPGDWAID